MGLCACVYGHTGSGQQSWGHPDFTILVKPAHQLQQIGHFYRDDISMKSNTSATHQKTDFTDSNVETVTC